MRTLAAFIVIADRSRTTMVDMHRVDAVTQISVDEFVQGICDSGLVG